MEDNEILEGNKLIAEFMGHKVSYGFQKVMLISTEEISYTPPKYYSSWDWLMPVVEKIEALDKWQIEIELFSCYVIKSDDLLSLNPFIAIESHEDSKMKAVYIAIIEFIKWYNKQKK